MQYLRSYNSPSSRNSQVNEPEKALSFRDKNIQAQSNIVVPVYMPLDVRQDDSHTRVRTLAILYSPMPSSDPHIIYADVPLRDVGGLAKEAGLTESSTHRKSP